MQMADILVFVGVAGDPCITADDLLGLPGVGFDQQLQITRGLMHVQAEGMGNRLLVHGGSPIEALQQSRLNRERSTLDLVADGPFAGAGRRPPYPDDYSKA